jgi:hypothetical protein
MLVLVRLLRIVIAANRNYDGKRQPPFLTHTNSLDTVKQ